MAGRPGPLPGLESFSVPPSTPPAPVAYLDHAATTPVLPEVAEVMAAQLARTGNANSLHSSGRAARRVVEEARERLAAAVGARPSEVVFTAGGTEADNIAVKGLYWARTAQDARRRRVLVSAVEHHAVLDPAAWLARRQGAQLQTIPVDHLGRIVPAALAELLGDGQDVALVSVMWANNEVGTLQPVEQVIELAHAVGVPVHTDAIQVVGTLPVDLAGTEVDLLTLSGHKLGGPVSSGALLVRRGVGIEPFLHGGGQEGQVRSGTVDVAGAAGLGLAVELAAGRQPATAERVGRLRDALVEAVQAAVPSAVLRGDPDPAGRLPGNAHFTFPGCEGDSLLYLLDARGVEASTGSACQAGVPQPSHVLLAMGIPEPDTRGALRFSLGHTSTEQDVQALAEAVGPVVERAQLAGLATSGRAG